MWGNTRGQRLPAYSHLGLFTVKILLRSRGCCWTSMDFGGSGWFLSTLVNLTKRADTGRINSSPVSTTSPVIRVQSGCPQDLVIPMEDPDGDVIRCRWARDLHECGGLCDVRFQYASLDQVTMVIVWIILQVCFPTLLREHDHTRYEQDWHYASILGLAVCA